jgi:hypothetical protein
MADADMIAALRVAAKRIPRAQAVTDLKAYADLDLSFHDLIYSAARHQKLDQCWTMLRPHIFRFLVSRTIANNLGRSCSDNEYDELAETIASRDSERAVVMIENDLNAAYRRLLERYRDFADRAVGQVEPSPTSWGKSRPSKLVRSCTDCSPARHQTVAVTKQPARQRLREDQWACVFSDR